MSTRSSVTRQTSQESDANNNFGSSLVNGQGVQFVVPNLPQAPNSYNPQTAAAMQQQFQRMAAPNGTNPTAGYAPVRQPRPGVMNASGPQMFVTPGLPVLQVQQGAFLQRHQTPGANMHSYYTLHLTQGQAGAAAGMVPSSTPNVPPNYYPQNQFAPPDPMSTPPPASQVPAGFFPGTGQFLPFGSPPQMAFGYPYQPQYVNGPTPAYGYPQPQQQQAMGQYMGQQPEFGTPVPGGMASQQSVPPSSMPQVSSAPVGMMPPAQTFQAYQSPQSQPQQPQQQATGRKKHILAVVNPDTQEDIMKEVIKEKEEQDQKHHQQYVQGGVWKPPPGQQQMYMENTERAPSRSASATPHSMTGQPAAMDMSQPETSKVNDFYNAFTEAVSRTSPPPTEMHQQQQQQSDRVILPPEHGDPKESSAAHLQFGVDETFMAASTSRKPDHGAASSALEFGWSPATNAVQEEMTATSEPDKEAEIEAAMEENVEEYQPKNVDESDNGRIGSDLPGAQQGISEQDFPRLRRPDLDLADEMASETASVTAASMQVQFDAQSVATAEDSTFDISSIPDGTSRIDSRLDDSVLDLSSAASVDGGDKVSEMGAGTEALSEYLALKAELERLLDPEGKYKYTREFMFVAAKLPVSKIRPQFDTTKWSAENLDDVFELRKSQKNSAQQFRSPLPASGSTSDFFNTPWMKTSPGGPPGRKVPYTGRFSDKNQDRRDQGGRGPRGGHGGRGSQMKQPIVIAAPLVDVELKKAEHAWKPGRKAESADDPDRAETDKLLKEVRGLLNKITPQTFDELSKEFLELEPRMNNAERAVGVVEIVFQKAVEEPKFCTMYSDLYDRMTKLQLQRQQAQQAASGQAATKSGSVALNKDTNFRYILLTKCQTCFDKDTKFEKMRKEKEEAIAAADSADLKKQLQDDLDEMLAKERRQSLGNMRFIGELYHRNMLTAKIMHSCVMALLRKAADDHEALESLCKLLTTIGRKFESDKKSEYHSKIDEYYNEMEGLSKNTQLPSRYRFMIFDLLDLRKNNWEPRSKGDGPKTIEQLHHEAHLERINQQIAIEQHEANKQAQDDSPNRGSRRGGPRRPDLPNRGSYGAQDFDGRGGGRASMGREQGRQQGQQAHLQESSSKFKQPTLSQHLDAGGVKLGPQRSQWAKGAGMGAGAGAGGAAPAAAPAPPRAVQQEPTFTSANRFSHLLMTDENRRETGSASSSRESSQTRYDEKKQAMDNVRQFVGSPMASSKPSERQDGSSAVARADVAKESTSSEMDDEKLKRYAFEMIDELVDTGYFNEAIALINDRKSIADRILSNALYHVMEKGEKHRRLLGELVGRWYAAEGQSADISKGFALFINNAIEDELAQDVPKLWAYLGQIVAAAIIESESTNQSNRLTLGHFRDAFQQAGDKNGAELIAQTLVAVKRAPTSNDGQVLAQYQSIASDPTFSNDQVVAALKKHEIDFLLNASSPSSANSATYDSSTSVSEKRVQATPPPTSPVGLPPYGLTSPSILRMGSVHSDLEADKAELERLVKTGKELAVDRLIAFVQNTKRLEDESDERSLTFLGALVQSLCSKVIVVGELDDSNSVNMDELERFSKVLLPFVKSRRSYEMKILDMLADIYHRINCPKGVLVKILVSLQDNGVIETEGFSEWWRTNEQSLPGMIRQSGEVKAFFINLADDGTSDAGSESDQGE